MPQKCGPGNGNFQPWKISPGLNQWVIGSINIPEKFIN
jgi:hypothetical protein